VPAPTLAAAPAERLLDRCAALARLLAEDVMSARFAVVSAAPAGTPFDAAEADDVFAAPPPGARILCTTELGLECLRRHPGTPEVPDGWTERTLLLKPKVLLDSVESLL
jgi:hypothetical protein